MRIRQVVPIALIALGAAACSGGSGGSPSTPSPSSHPTSAVASTSDPPSSSAPSSPTVPTTGPNVRSGEKPPVLPGLAHSRSTAGALAFSAFWFQAFDWAYATMSTTLLEENYAKSCSDCVIITDFFAKLRRRGDFARGGRLHFLESDVAPNDHRDGASKAIDVAISQDKGETVSESGKIVARAPAESRAIFRLWLKWSGNTWITVQKGQVK